MWGSLWILRFLFGNQQIFSLQLVVQVHPNMVKQNELLLLNLIRIQRLGRGIGTGAILEFDPGIPVVAVGNFQRVIDALHGIPVVPVLHRITEGVSYLCKAPTVVRSILAVLSRFEATVSAGAILTDSTIRAFYFKPRISLRCFFQFNQLKALA